MSKILITNDDGINSEGVIILKESLISLGETIIIAPDRERSCISHAVTIHRPLRIEKVKEGIYSVDGTPVDCINLGLSGFIKGEVDLVIAGINKGPNLGEDTEYSGTVSAAKEATLLGVKSFAISLTARNTFFFSTASFVAKEIAKIILEKGLPENTFLNINVPNIPLDEVKSYQITSLGKRDYKSQLVQKRDPRGKLYYWLGGDGDRFQFINGTDFFAIKNGHISITPLIIDRTNYNVMEKLKILIPEKVKVSF